MSNGIELQHTLSFSSGGKKWDSAVDVDDVITKINACSCLKSLLLDGNTLGVEAAEAIGCALSEHPEFERALWKDLFTGRLKTEIPIALTHLFSGLIKANAKIVELDLSDNALGPVGVDSMTEFIKSPVCYSLQELRLNNNGLGSKGGAMLAKALLDLKDNSERAGTPLKLKVFIVGRNKLENDGAESFSEFFSAIGTLEVIEMPQNCIFHDGVAMLAEAFSKNKNLKIINLNDNIFTAKGAMSMAEYLPKLENLETINFGDCLLRNNGTIYLADCLVLGHHKLENLHMDGNEIRLSGALALVDAIADKPNLNFFGLEYNQIGEEIPVELSDRLIEIDKLETLAYDDNEEPDSDDCESAQENEYELSDEFEFVRNEQQTDEEEYADSYESDSHQYTSPLKRGVTATDFLLQPCISVLMKLGDATPHQLLHEYKLAAVVVAENVDILYEEALVNELFTGVMNLSSVDCSKTQEIAMVNECTKMLWNEAFNIADKLGINVVTNSLLIHLGEVKSENKKFKIVWNIEKCLKKLQWLIMLPCVPFETKVTLRSLLSLPGSKLSSYLREVQELIDVLT